MAKEQKMETEGWERMYPQSAISLMARNLIISNLSSGNRPGFADYKVRNHKSILEVSDDAEAHGYSFVGETQLDRDVEGRLQRLKRQYEADGRTIERYFVDLRPGVGIAGLEWKK